MRRWNVRILSTIKRPFGSSSSITLIDHPSVASTLNIYFMQNNTTPALCTFRQHNVPSKTSTRLASGSQLIEERSSPGSLASSEPVHARVGAVVHPVVDRVNTATRASVLANRAAGSRGTLRRCVGDLVASTSAAALEDVVETEPVADFVGGSGTLVVRSGGSAGQGVCQVDTAIKSEVGGSRV